MKFSTIDGHESHKLNLFRDRIELEDEASVDGSDRRVLLSLNVVNRRILVRLMLRQISAPLDQHF